MKKLTTILSVAALVASAGAFAKDGLYVSAQAGAARQSLDLSIDKAAKDAGISGISSVHSVTTTKPTFDVAVGYNLGDVAVEAEVAYSKADDLQMDDSALLKDNKNYNVMVNGLYHFDVQNAPVKPYVGAGLGMTHASHGVLVGDQSEQALKASNRVAYQGIAGVSYELADNLDLNTDYRHIATFEKNKTSLSQDSVNVGLTYKF